MDCERCHERPARYHVTRVVNGQTVQDLHLCERCAAEQGEVAPGLQAESHATIHQLLAGLLSGSGTDVAGGGTGRDASLVCAHCGYTYPEFARTGLVGCPHCYDAFAVHLDPLIARIHGKSRHDGKVPARTGADARRQRALEELRRELERAVAREEFEQAAALRDQIRALQGLVVAAVAVAPPTGDPAGLSPEGGTATHSATGPCIP